jgi:hypothetical protein
MLKTTEDLVRVLEVKVEDWILMFNLDLASKRCGILNILHPV